jgi:hypothetical protein
MNNRDISSNYVELRFNFKSLVYETCSIKHVYKLYTLLVTWGRAHRRDMHLLTVI